MRTFKLRLDEKAFLLSLARKCIKAKLDNRQPQIKAFFSENLKKPSGVFVTLNKNDRLRGCIGYVEGITSLQNAIEEMSIAAAFEDPRFSPLEKEELKDLDIEISVLSPLQTIRDVGQIEIGTHGLIIEKGYYKGLLLPQVAVEYQWDVPAFLKFTCQKAGLPSDAWKDPETKIQIFSAEIFSENIDQPE